MKRLISALSVILALVSCGESEPYVTLDGRVELFDLTNATPVDLGENYRAYEILDSIELDGNSYEIRELLVNPNPGDLRHVTLTTQLKEDGRLGMNLLDKPNESHFTHTDDFFCDATVSMCYIYVREHESDEWFHELTTSTASIEEWHIEIEVTNIGNGRTDSDVSEEYFSYTLHPEGFVSRHQTAILAFESGRLALEPLTEYTRLLDGEPLFTLELAAPAAPEILP